jgi:hypothetical protein
MDRHLPPEIMELQSTTQKLVRSLLVHEQELQKFGAVPERAKQVRRSLLCKVPRDR